MSDQCPACGSTRVVEIVWGMPTEELFRETPDDVELAGCVLPPAPFTRRCGECGARWTPLDPPHAHGDRA